MALKAVSNAIDLKNTESALKQALTSSSTAYGRNVSPTAADLSNQIKLMNVQKTREAEEQAKLREKIYGPPALEQKTLQQEKSEGPIGRALSAIQTPLYGVVGAVEALTGTGSKKGAANILANIKERGLFGDLLKKSSVPSVISMPLGFALDVALDPLTWMTLGTEAIVPRVAKGLYSGGLSGAKLATTSGALTKFERLGRLVPGLASRAAGEAPTGAAKVYKNIATAAQAGRKEFRNLYGVPLEQEMAARAAKPRWGERLEQQVSKEPESLFSRFINSFRFKNNWYENIKKTDEALANPNLAGDDVDIFDKYFLPQSRNQIREVLSDSNQSKVGLTGLVNKLNLEQGNAGKILNEGLETAFYDGKRLRALNEEGLPDADAVYGRLADEAENEKAYQEFMNEFRSLSSQSGLLQEKVKEAMAQLGKTEIGWYDRLMDSLKDKNKHPIINNILDKYEGYIGLFKDMKTGGNPASLYVYAPVGNSFMGEMSGLKVFTTDFFSYIKDTNQLLRGKSTPGVRKLLDQTAKDLGWQKFLESYSGVVKKVYGFDPAIFTEYEKQRELILSKAAQKFKASEVALARQEIDNAMNRIMSQLASRAVPAEMSRVATEGEVLPSYLSAELYSSSFKDLVSTLEKSNSKVLNFVGNYLTKSLEKYDRVDQTFKLGSALYMTQRGIDEEELKLLSRWIRINPSDYKEVNGLYRLTPDKATEASLEIYMNYAAMPAFVKMMRSIPLLGSPFASFMYTMGAKTGKTLMYNPALFSKVQSFLGELEGQPSPLEKEALKQPYYQWYNKPGMVKLPFFKDNPVYLNMTNMIPYYTMNIFQPSERRYSSKVSGIAASFFDRFPIFKTPEGQIMFDYLVQPLILREATPKGMFDQPIWPYEATAFEKGRNLVRDLVETVVPPQLGLVAGVPSGLLAPDVAANYLPSYQWRKIMRATSGKTAEGVQTKEPAVQKTVRALLGGMGIPLQELPLENIATNVQKNLNE